MLYRLGFEIGECGADDRIVVLNEGPQLSDDRIDEAGDQSVLRKVSCVEFDMDDVGDIGRLLLGGARRLRLLGTLVDGIAKALEEHRLS